MSMPKDRDESPSHGVSARRRAATAGVVGILVGAGSGAFIPWPLTPLVAWDVAALTFVTWIWLRIWKMDAVATARHAEQEDPTRAAADLLVLTAAVTSLIAVGYVLVRAASSSGFVQGLQAGFGAASVVVSWSVVHTVYALRYARLYYAGVDGGADFHQSTKPQYSDFAYLSFTVGMTFQVSDTELNETSFRATVLRHSLLSYLFGTVIVALTINLVGGLGH
jgi:uncharacterized membrane protein